MKRFFLRTSAGGKLGWGNLHRILIIFDFLKKKNEVVLLVEGNRYVFDYLKKKSVSFKKIKNLSEEKKVLKKIGKSDVTFLEVLKPSLKLQRIYKKHSKKLVVLDDLLSEKYISDIVISCQKNKEYVNIKDDQKIFNDYNFFPLKKSFDKFIKKKKKINKKVRKILVFLGGGMYNKEVLSLANALNKTNFNLSFLIGNEKADFLVKNLRYLNKKFKVYVNCTDIPQKIFQSDLIITGGGYTKIEAAFLKTPMICISVQKHQNKLVKNFKNLFGVDVIEYKKSNKLKLRELISRQNFEKRKKISKKFSKYFLKNGLQRIIDKTI